MKYSYTENAVESTLLLRINEDNFDKYFFKNRNERFLTITWNRGEEQTVWVDEVAYQFPKNSILALMVNQSFRFERPANLVSWQFNREFYCIVDHDREVSCVGFLFYGMRDLLFINLDEKNATRLDLLVKVFADEFETRDNIQGEMLRMMLKRLIIIVTRLAKEQSIQPPMKESDFDIVRKFNIAVENHYKTKHQVQDYADLLNKSPKTLSNLFSIYNHKSPLHIIHERVSLEAKRLLIYTDKSTKEIAFELGFEEVAHFSRFFKKQIGQAPTEFKLEMRKH
ncbi:MAG: AraC family transcriptional regulator [Cytophagaceae bacterium BCCC1]|nr:MAG: AraC family transcriptional regulator [Cytophagaceae bacterium BCCC1]